MYGRRRRGRVSRLGLGYASLSNPDTEIDVNTLERVQEFHNKKSVAYKTVETFSGLTKTKLWLKDASPPSTDGHEIKVPFAHPEMYRLVEHELSHVLFRSDTRAKSAFLNEYGKRVLEVARGEGVELHEGTLGQILGHVIGVLEDRRVNSLWGLLYRGSATKMRALSYRELLPYSELAAENLMAMFSCIEAGVSIPEGELDRFKPYFEEALRKVTRKGFVATLAVSKWLVTSIVSEIIRKARKEPPPQCSQKQKGERKPEDEDEEGQAGGSPGGDEDDDDSAENRENHEGGGDQEEGNGDGDQDQDQDSFEQPPTPKASKKERSEALKELMSQAQGMSGSEKLMERGQDWLPSKFARRGEEQQAKDLAKDAIDTDVVDQDALQDLIDASADEMEGIIDAAREAVRNQWTEAEWLQKDAMAKLTLKDIKPCDLDEDQPEPTFEEQETVNKLRAMFHRVMGKRRTSLEDAGSEIDIQAYLESQLLGEPLPCFKTETQGRGFKALILIDRSGSMSGAKEAQAERACRMLARALKFPFVELQVWGFCAHEAGQIELQRYERGMLKFKSEKAQSNGATPLHVAVRLGIRELVKGSDAKHLFVLTDGHPVHTARDGRSISTRQLMHFVRDEVLGGRRQGINITGVLIGEMHMDYGTHQLVASYDMKPEHLAFMFGSRRNWEMMSSDRLGNGLTRLVASSFADYLRR